jgi:hypothetical protein
MCQSLMKSSTESTAGCALTGRAHSQISKMKTPGIGRGLVIVQFGVSFPSEQEERLRDHWGLLQFSRAFEGAAAVPARGTPGWKPRLR